LIVIIWGVAGSGKTTVARELARRLGCEAYDADEFHPKANIQKMAAGQPLSDGDRQPWLADLRRLVDQYDTGETAVLACSALKASYRKTLGFDQAYVRSVLLNGDYALIADRLRHRHDHFMPADLLRSQFDSLETGHRGLTLNVSPTTAELVDEIMRWLH
jgi:carbohydrate kinase (thermoresistant glucokinase family)